MDQIVKKVQELGLTLPKCPAPLAAYIPATRNGDTIYVSGQLPSINGDFSAFCGFFHFDNIVSFQTCLFKQILCPTFALILQFFNDIINHIVIGFENNFSYNSHFQFPFLSLVFVYIIIVPYILSGFP